MLLKIVKNDRFCSKYQLLKFFRIKNCATRNELVLMIFGTEMATGYTSL